MKYSQCSCGLVITILGYGELVFAGPVHRTEKNPRTELNRTMVRSIFRLRLPEFGAIPVAGCRVSKIF